MPPAPARPLTVSLTAAAMGASLVMLASCGRATQADPPRAPRPDAPTAQVDALHAACVLSMVNSVCRAANDRSANNVPPADTVFVAGVGPVDASAYRAIRDSGDAMCDTVRVSCTAAWDGPACRTARSLWPALPPAP